MPICRTCNKEKSINNFYKEARNKSKVRNECKSCFKIKYDARYHAKRDEILEKGRQRNREFKTEVMQHYGGKCDCCGIDVLEFLSIDHINGGGNVHRKEINNKGGMNFYRWLKQNNWPQGYRVLCFNCNMAIGSYGECPHAR